MSYDMMGTISKRGTQTEQISSPIPGRSLLSADFRGVDIHWYMWEAYRGLEVRQGRCFRESCGRFPDSWWFSSAYDSLPA